MIFHPRTLAELCYLKLILKNPKTNEEKILVGTVLGIMHGAERKDGTSGYLSVSMPNTFSMSPEYVRRFVQTNQLNREYRNTFQLLRKKITRTYEKHSFPRNSSSVHRSDAKTISKTDEFKKLKNKVNLILTSPPYLGIVNYARQNWIRSWFLDANPELISNELDDDLNLFEWIKFSKNTVSQLKKLLKPNGVAVFVIGDVAKSKNSIISLAREFAVMIKENQLFKNVWIFSDYIQGVDKTTRIWGETKGKATTIDRIVILSDFNPFKDNQRLNGESYLTYDLIKESTKHFMGNMLKNK